jgi:hypothetical protein
MRRRTLLGAVIAGIALWSSLASTAHAIVRVDHVQVPFYARNIVGEKWTATIFYRPPECIRADFNLVTFFDPPRAFACAPMTMDGFALFENGPGIDPAPLLSILDGQGAVPIWFTRTRRFQAARADGVVTVGELAALKPLRGSASVYSELLGNDGIPGSTGFYFSAFAQGKLADHRSFSYVTLRTIHQGLILAEFKTSH